MRNIIQKLVTIMLMIVCLQTLVSKAVAQSVDYQSLNLLAFTGERQLVLGEYDALGRATFAHIQLQEGDEPQTQRPERIHYDPVGWHNFKMIYGAHGKKAYLFNRGHLIGYQFSGLNDEGRNLVPLTAWTNSGNYAGIDDTNIEGMLYYENRLDNWLALHPNYWLDYRVVPLYTENELIPRQILLQYVGMDASGDLLPIQLGGDKETVDAYGITTVILDNYSKNATIDYLTGTAVPSLVPTETVQQSVETSENGGAANVATQRQLAEVVYIARNGKADVYWYSKDNMPSNTNFSKVIEMSEQEALNLGKRHTTKE